MGPWLDLFFVLLLFLLFVCLSVRAFSFLNRKCFFSNGLFHFYNLHDVPCDERFFFFFLGGGGGGVGEINGVKFN